MTTIMRIRRGPSTGRPGEGRQYKVWLTADEAAAAQLAADVRLWREREQLGDGSLSREVGVRVAPGLARDVAAWAEDPSLPVALRERARALTRPPAQR